MRIRGTARCANGRLAGRRAWPELTRIWRETIIGLFRGVDHAETDLSTEKETARPCARLQGPYEHSGRPKYPKASHVQGTPQAHCLTGPSDGHAKGQAPHQIERLRGGAALWEKLVGQIPGADRATEPFGCHSLWIFGGAAGGQLGTAKQNKTEAKGGCETGPGPTWMGPGRHRSKGRGSGRLPSTRTVYDRPYRSN